MKLAAIEIVGMLLSLLILAAVFVIPVILMVLCIRALWIYIRTHAKAQEVKKETAAVRRTLSETLKDHRTRCKMTQEFVAESLGVSRQAVSKWETGETDPTMSNLACWRSSTASPWPSCWKTSSNSPHQARASAWRFCAMLQGEPISACYAGQKFLPPGIPLGTKFGAEPRTRRKAARTLSAPNFPVCVPSIRTCRLDGTF